MMLAFGNLCSEIFGVFGTFNLLLFVLCFIFPFFWSFDYVWLILFMTMATGPWQNPGKTLVKYGLKVICRTEREAEEARTREIY